MRQLVTFGVFFFIHFFRVSFVCVFFGLLLLLLLLFEGKMEIKIHIMNNGIGIINESQFNKREKK